MLQIPGRPHGVALVATWLLAAGIAAGAQAPTERRTAGPGYREVGASITGASEVRAAPTAATSRLAFESSDAPLVSGFEWAKRQALAFVFEDDTVGPWYEAAEPGREAFCMRDVAHQAMGAHALGLARHNRNMLRRFAEAVSDARDWCSFWEIDRHGRPAPVDYRNDAEFWYNLPASFDVLDCSYRMYVWTGDPAYVEDPVFLDFYDRTTHDYVERWGLGLDQIMRRPRLLNVRGMTDPGKKFQANRGIPGYDEQEHRYVLGVDLLATQYAAYGAYARIQEARGDVGAARAFFRKAADVRALVNTTWWNESGQHFYARLNEDHELEGRAGHRLLYRGVVEDGPKLRAALGEGQGSAEVLYRYGNPDLAYDRLIEIAHGTRSRREYPEVPFSWLGALVNGTMGVTLEASSPLESQTEGYWVATVVKTLSGLGSKVGWAALAELPVRANAIAVRHDGTRKTAFTNLRGPALIWKAAFAGPHETLLVNGRPTPARQEAGSLGDPVSWVRVALGGGGTVTVEVPR